MRKAIVCGLILAGSIFGQAPEPKLEFEAASVRQAAPPAPGEVFGMFGGPGSTDPERVRFRGASLQSLLVRAFDLPLSRLSAPDWLETTQFDITAKLPAGATAKQVNRMLRSLLVDRFKLVARTEKRDFPVYDLVVAKGGIKMKVSTAEPPPPPASRGPVEADPAKAAAAAAALQAQIRANRGAVDKDGFPALPDDNIATQRTGVNNGRAWANARGQTVEQIATILQRNGGLGVGARVTDKTGLTGRYDFKLEYASAVSTASDDPLPDVFSAVQSQLGLKLEKGTAQFDVLVIDHIEKTPTDN
jgi:uncharacterized protein (TIGR03435 family)